jgi:hypothetical protein
MNDSGLSLHCQRIGKYNPNEMEKKHRVFGIKAD